MHADTAPSDAEAVRHDPAAKSFTRDVEGHKALLDYRLEDGRMVITHTVVPPAIEGRGIASQLTRAAFEHARDQGWKVRPACSYAKGWATRHPEFSPVLG